MEDELNPDKMEEMVCLLRKNARSSLTEMAVELELSVSRVHKMLSILKKRHITKSCCLPDFRKLGYPIIVCFAVKAKDREALFNCIKDETSINEIVRINNGYDFLIEAIFKDMSTLYGFSDKLKGFSAGMNEYHIVEELQREKVLTDKNHFLL